MTPETTLRPAIVVCLALALSLAPCAAQVPTDSRDGRSELVPVAQRFCSAFFAGDGPTLREMMSGRLKDDFPAEKATELRSGLTGKYGELARIEPAWFEDVVNAQRRYRVPVVFSKEGRRTTVDLSLTFNLQGQVTAFHVAPHVTPSAEGKTEAPSAPAPEP